MQKRISAFVGFLFVSIAAVAQTFTLEGTMADSATRQPLIGVNVIITNTADSTVKYYAATGLDGRFAMKNITAGRYRLVATYIGYTTLVKTLRITENMNMGRLDMPENPYTVSGGVVEGKIPPVVIKEDTTEYNAEAYKTNPDATAEDLVKKMPGVTVENGQVKAQGEDVKKVLVDGKEFFGDDPTLALRNLPADMIDKVQVFDRASDQAAFTGVDDGNSSKTINIITRKDRREGVFGRVYAGYGTDDRYNTGLSLNIMKNKHRFSIVGMGNNINQQNFASEDLVGLSGGSGGRGGGGYRGGMGGASNFMVGQQRGISTTNSLGFNYSGSLSSKVTLTGSYFYNNSNTENDQDINRTYFLGGDSAQLYTENAISGARNFNHRANFRLEYNIDSSNSLIFTPRISFQTNNSENRLTGRTRLQSELPLSQLTNINTSSLDAYNLNSDLLYRHKFAKQGRTLSFNITTGLNDRTGNTSLFSNNVYFDTATHTNTLDQRANTATSGINLSARIAYTEPLSKKSVLQFTYSPSRDYSKSDKETFNNTPEGYTDLDTSLSNAFNTTYTTHRGGLDYTYTIKEGTSLSAELEYQQAKLASEQTFPVNNPVNRTFNNVLPSLSFRHKFSEKANLRARYRTRTNAPSVSQLQNLVNNTNPLLLSTGNPGLVQEYNHFLFGRYMIANPQKSRNTFIMMMAQHTQNYIGTSTTIATRDTVLNGAVLNRGTQLTMPVNMDGYWNARSFFMYSLPVAKLKSTLNTMTGATYTRTPSLINNQKNLAHSTTLTEGITLSSNVSKELDFTVSYSANYNIVKNTIRPELNNNFFFHTAGAKLNWIFWKGMVLQTEATQTLYSGLSGGFNQNYLLWNASIGKKFLKNQSGELKLTVFDILSQNNSISRTVTETYVEDVRSQVLQRYFMLTFTYTLKYFKKGSAPVDEPVPATPMMPMHPHGPGR